MACSTDVVVRSKVMCFKGNMRREDCTAPRFGARILSSRPQFIDGFRGDAVASPALAQQPVSPESISKLFLKLFL